MVPVLKKSPNPRDLLSFPLCIDAPPFTTFQTTSVEASTQHSPDIIAKLSLERLNEFRLRPQPRSTAITLRTNKVAAAARLIWPSDRSFCVSGG